MKGWISGFLMFACLLYSTNANAQRWSITDQTQVETKGVRDILPQKYVVYTTDYTVLKEVLWTAPHESLQPVSSSQTLVTIGLADGSADIFRIVRYDMMESGLSDKYPDIRTFRGESISGSGRTIRADWTENGFRAVIRDENGMMYIDPYQRNDPEHRVVYYRKDYQSSDEWTCGVSETEAGIGGQHTQRIQGDCQFRTYRLAQATTAEYSNYFGATSPANSGLVLAQVVTAINRVNEVYEADVAVRLILVANTNLVFYYDAATDPYTNNNGSNMLGQNQTNLDAVIGNSNYDIGHVFSTGGGGVAYLGSVCSVSNKARGVTGRSAPVGDPFTIDYVAHEMGHQFGGNHTFNGTAGSCSGNRSSSSAYEPGSGSTIMAYAGICGAQDLQPNSDAYFHARSILEIANHVTSTTCAAFIPLNNLPPVVTSVPDYTIPISTPFVLTGIASDPNGDPLTFCWEQYDLEVPANSPSEPPTSNDADGPLFRSFNPSSSPFRYIPRLSDLTTNTNYAWEVLPSVTRTMAFRMTVRDYHNIGGCTKEDNIVISANAAAGPFIVTSQNAGASWAEGSVQTITWNVANTNIAPVNCTNVDIRLSYDGGFTYPEVLSLNEPNDGSANVTIPPGITATGRVMVKGSNNIFFDINNANISIILGLPNFNLSLEPNTITECNDGSVQTTVSVGQFMGFSNPVTMSLINTPPGAIVTFNPPIVNPGSNTTLTISNLQALFGTYTPSVRGTSTTGNIDAPLTINLLQAPTIGPTLLSPANNEMNAFMIPLLDWSVIAGSSEYEYQIAADNSFSSILLSGTAPTDQYQLTSALGIGNQYFWRVRAMNMCGQGVWSSTFSFTTIGCFSLMSPNVPVAIPETGTPTVTSTLSVPASLVINDLDIIGLVGTHTYIDDLRFTLKAPNTTQVIFWNQPCTSQDNFNINFDDEASPGTWPCPPTNGLTYRPSLPLTPFDGVASNGVWTMQINDLANIDGGSLISWGLKVCGSSACQLLVNQTSGSGAGTLAAALNCAANGDSIKLSAALAGQTINIGSSPLQVNSNVIIVAQAPDMTITTSGPGVFEIPNARTVQLNGMTILAGTSLTGGAINNSGILNLRDVTISQNPLVSNAVLLQNAPGSQLFLRGNCFISQ